MSYLRERILKNYWGNGPQRLFDQHFGLGLSEDEVVFPSSFASKSSFSSPLISRTRESKSDTKVFQVMLDVQQFHPRELKVKTHEGFIIVEGKHAEKEDEHGFITRQFTRRYAIPSDVRADDVQCNFSPDGILLITANRNPVEDPKNERSVPIFSTY